MKELHTGKAERKAEKYMNILVFGGTRFFGIKLIENLLKNGHQVTIATRGIAKDRFGDSVTRLVVERGDAESLAKLFENREYDCIFDNICYTSNDVKRLLTVAKGKRYIMTSTMSVYPTEVWGEEMNEADFEPQSFPLKWMERKDAPYEEIKRQAEAALFQKFTDIQAAAVRFPFVIGSDDYTKRLYFYVENVIKQKPMYVDNLNAQMSFIEAEEAGKFLAWMIESGETGIFNGANAQTVSLKQILQFVEERTGKKAILSKEGIPAPYNGTRAYSLDTSKAERRGYVFTTLDSFLPKLLEEYIRQADS